MLPNLDPRQMKAMMRQMGMSQEDISATKVIIQTTDKDIVFNNPGVQKVSMGGQTSFQITGEFEELEGKKMVSISQEDIDMVSQNTNTSQEIAKEHLEKNEGDIAKTILSLNEELKNK